MKLTYSPFTPKDPLSVNLARQLDRSDLQNSSILPTSSMQHFQQVLIFHGFQFPLNCNETRKQLLQASLLKAP